MTQDGREREERRPREQKDRKKQMEPGPIVLNERMEIFFLLHNNYLSSTCCDARSSPTVYITVYPSNFSVRFGNLFSF